jgi:hypothetical protein
MLQDDKSTKLKDTRAKAANLAQEASPLNAGKTALAFGLQAPAPALLPLYFSNSSATSISGFLAIS